MAKSYSGKRGALGMLPLLIFGWAALFFVLANVLVFGSGQLSAEDCARLVARIDAELAPSTPQVID